MRTFGIASLFASLAASVVDSARLAHAWPAERPRAASKRRSALPPPPPTGRARYAGQIRALGLGRRPGLLNRRNVALATKIVTARREQDRRIQARLSAEKSYKGRARLAQSFD